ncbi:hypothetical protein QQX98_008933 [Neonectria punicea]|uniref:Serine protease n=1 Tax=Neonectria punicea TaxID=979145 RepID=A0ABR1GTN2_9HYPO
MLSRLEPPLPFLFLTITIVLITLLVWAALHVGICQSSVVSHGESLDARSIAVNPQTVAVRPFVRPPVKLPDGWMSNRIKAAAWKLQETGVEVCFGINPRRLVPESDVHGGGRYSGILEIYSTFQAHNGTTLPFHGTAFVIDKYHVLTVAHNIWHADFGRARAVTLYMDHRVDPNGQHSRQGSVVAAGYQYVYCNVELNDFAIVKVSEPFDTAVVVPLRVDIIPTNTTIDVTVLGYPFDMPKNRRGERQSHLCQSSSQVKYDGTDLVEHIGDTGKAVSLMGLNVGNSGGPVITDANIAIAVHRGWGYRKTIGNAIGKVVGKIERVRIYDPEAVRNKAVPINHHGNDIPQFVAVLADMEGAKGGPNSQQVRRVDAHQAAVDDNPVQIWEW